MGKSFKPSHLCYFAEREGFEPPVPLSTTVFKTVVIDHSTISPWASLSEKRVQRYKKEVKIEERKVKNLLPPSNI